MKPVRKSSLFFRDNISSRVLVIGGLLSIPPFLLQPNPLLLFAQVLLFIITAAASGKRFRPAAPLILLFSLTLLHLISPLGRVLFSLGRWNITEGALSQGLQKSLTLIGLIYLSKATVRSDLRLPGRFGSLLGRTFYYFNMISETWKTIPRQNIVSRLDQLFCTIQPGNGEEPHSEGTPVTEQRISTSAAGFLFIILFSSAQWVLFFLHYQLTQLPFS